LLRFVVGNKINVRDLKLLNPNIAITKNRSYVPEESRAKTDTVVFVTRSDGMSMELADSLALQELKEATEEFFPPISISNLSVLSGSFEFFDGLVDYPIQKVSGLDLILKGVYYEDGKKNYTAEDLSFIVDSASTLVSQNMAKLSISGMYITTDTFHIDNLHYGHLVSPSTVNRIKGFRASWLDIKLDHIDLQLVDLEKMVEQSSLLIPLLSIGSVNLHFFKHKHEMRINPAYKALPHELVQSIPFRFALDSLIAHNAYMLIEMQAPHAKRSGILTIDSAQLSLSNMTNIPSRISANPVMELNLDAKLMREGPASVKFKFLLNSPELEYQAELKAGPMNASLLNGFLGSQFSIDFKSGYIDKIHLSYRGDKRVNIGKMDFEYTNLRVRQFENPEKYMEDSPKRKFLTGVANAIIPKNNTSDMKKYHPGLVYYEREYNRDFLHGMIMSLVSGLMSTFGFGVKNEEKLQKKVDALDDLSMQKSAKTAQDKADRADSKRVTDKEKQLRQEKKRKSKEEKKAKKQGKGGL
jgi:hypothetical protein